MGGDKHTRGEESINLAMSHPDKEMLPYQTCNSSAV